MKMAACTIQQKVIGEQLGNSIAVRRAVGIHKPAIRAIEAVLKRPGLSFGKCMILCGGPDWPTSVLAGILRLSVWQCLLGTCPVIASIVPMALTGSFYLKRDESEVWTRTGNLMLFVTTLVSAVFLVGIGWAIQDEYDKRGSDLTKPREEFLELEWLDFRAGKIAEKCRASWVDVPRLVRLLYGFGAVFATLSGHLFLWCTSRCFGAFTLTDDITSLTWLGPSGLVRPLGLVGLAAGSASYFGLLTYNFWYRSWSRSPRSAALADLASQEEGWKNAWLEDLHKQNHGGLSGEGNPSEVEGKKSEGEVEVPTLLSARTRSFGSPSASGRKPDAAAGSPATSEANAKAKAGSIDVEPRQHDGEGEEADVARESVDRQSGSCGGEQLGPDSVAIDVCELQSPASSAMLSL